MPPLIARSIATLQRLISAEYANFKLMAEMDDAFERAAWMTLEGKIALVTGGSHYQKENSS